jgi:DNA processing protein
MSSRRNTARELSATEIEALVRLRVLRVPDTTLLRELPRKKPSQILARQNNNTDPVIDNRVERALLELDRLRVGVVTVADAHYPESLHRLGPLMPPVLFYRGNFELANSNIVSIVGTRRSTEYGNAAADMLSGELARRGVTIISGLALGIDAHAHIAALENDGNTIAVLGCGINVLYPHRNAKLQERIAQEGLLISEFAPGEPAMKHHFLQRNRIIALLAGGVVVVEADTRSGSLNTAKWAMDYGVETFAVPGPIGRNASFGTNALLLDGAKMVTCVRDIVDELPWPVTPLSDACSSGTSSGNPTDKLAARIFKALGPVAVQIDQIARTAGCSSSDALFALAELEMAGLVRQLPGKRFSVAKVRTG